MSVILSIKAQNTFTTNVLKADSAAIIYTRSDSVSAGIVRTDTLCSAKDLCVHQNAKISGDVEVSGKVMARSGIMMDTNHVGLFKAYYRLPVIDSVQGNAQQNMPMILAGPIGNGGPNEPPIDYDPCEGGQLVDTSYQEGSGGFIAKGVRSNVVNATVGMWIDWWTGNGMIDVMGQGIYGNDHGLYVNYNCGKNIYLGTGFGSGGDWKGKLGSKIYTGDYVEMRKRLQIGSPQWGVVNDPNNVALEVHTNSGTGIRVKTYTINDPEISVMNTNTLTSAAYNSRNTFVVYGDGKMKIRSWNIVEPMISVGKFTGSSDAGTEYFKVYVDGRTFIGSKIIKPTNAHSNAILQVAGKIGCMELVVLDPITKWADYVFDEKYSLPSIKEVEKYVKTYKHLPEVPTEKEISENGLNVYEMNAVLLKKVEEQMLYIIQLNKKIEGLEKEVKKIKHESGK